MGTGPKADEAVRSSIGRRGDRSEPPPPAAVPALGMRVVLAARGGELVVWLLGLIATVAVLFAMRTTERERVRLAFERESLRSFDVVKQVLVSATDIVSGYAAHVALVPADRCGSQRYARAALARHPSLQGLSWNALVPGAGRAAFEATERQTRPGFGVTEKDASGAFVPALARARYVVVTCMEPAEGNEKAIGFDLASEAARAEAIDKTFASRAPAATSRIRLVQDTTGGAGVLLLSAVVDAESGANVGTVSTVLRIDKVFAQTLAAAPSGVAVGLFDEARGREVLYALGDGVTEASGLAIELPINVADRPWSLRAVMSPLEVRRRMSLLPWACLPLGVAMTWLATRLIRSERAAKLLLQNVLPREIALRLTREGRRVAEQHEAVSVLFADIVAFTPVASRLTPNEVLALLDELFSRFDRITDERGVETIKTIGDCYMAVGGLDERPDPTFRLVCAAQEMIGVARRRGLALRIGIHAGPAVAGVIGERRLAYDLWGDTVNVASRMETYGVSGRIALSEEAYLLLGGRVSCEPRAPVAMKGLGERTSWLVCEPESEPTSSS